MDSRGRDPGCGALRLMTHDEAGKGRPGLPPCAGSPVPPSPSLRGGAGPEESWGGTVHGGQLRLELKAAAGERDFTCARALGTEFTEMFI